VWKLAIILLIVGASLIPYPILAETSSDITITAMGYICGAPGDFTLTYVSDYEVGISWVIPEDATNIIVRAAFGHVPEDISDGYQVYFGDGVSCTDTALSLASPEVIYYRAWCQRSDGVWSNLFSSGNTEGFMSTSFLFIGLVALAIALTVISIKANLLLFRVAAAASWLALGVWLLLSNTTNLSMSTTWTQILGFVFVMMTIAPLTLQMVTEVKKESKGKVWSEWARKPKEPIVSRSAKVREEYRSKLRGGRAR